MLDTHAKNTKPTKLQCVWKKVLSDSFDGTGTSYDTRHLTAKQNDCAVCSGCRTDCSIYCPHQH